MTDSIVARRLAAGYRGIEVLHGLDFELSTREVSIILGPGGAGKSTLLEALAGQTEHPELWVAGGLEIREERSPGILRQKPRVTGLVRQLLEGVPVEEVWRCAPDAARLLHEVSDQECGSLPTSTRRLVELTVLMASDRSLLLLDEPTAEMGLLEAGWVIAKLHEMKGRRTVVVVTHNLRIARQVGDFILFLLEGRIDEALASQHFFERPPSSRAGHFVRMGT